MQLELYLQIDISLQYQVLDQPKYFGLQIQQIEAKQQLTSFNNSLSQTAQNSIHCEVTNIRAYVGVKSAQRGTFKDTQFVRYFDNVRKKYLLTKCTLNILLNIAERSLQVQSNNIQIDFQDILIHEILNLSQISSKHFQKDLRYRPGQGSKILIKPLPDSTSKFNKPFRISEGSLQWWQMLGQKLVQNINKRTYNNLISNSRYRKYLFCILYRYTYGAHVQLQKFVDQFEKFKSDLQIMRQNKLLLSKIQEVRATRNIQQVPKEIRVFLTYVMSIQKTNPQLIQLRLKKLNYKDIRDSQVIINYKNCKKFILIKETQQKNSFIIKVNIKSFNFNINRSKIYHKIKNDIYNMTPNVFHYRKRKILEHYCTQSILDDSSFDRSDKNIQNKSQSQKQIKKQKSKQKSITYFELIISNLDVLFSNGNQTQVRISKFQINDKQTKNKIVKISKLSLLIQNMPLQSYSLSKMTVEKRMEFNVDLIFAQADSQFVQKLLTILGYINKSQIEVVENEQKNFITKFISKKVPTHPIFHNYKRDSMLFNVRRLIVSIPVFFNERNFQVFLKGIQFQDNALGKITVDIQQSFISRSATVSTLKKIDQNYQKTGENNDEVIILANTRSYSGFIQQPGYAAQNNKNSVSTLVMPFLLIQLSLQDIYYLQNILNLWNKMLSNPYYFPSKKIKTRTNISQINPNSINFAKQMSFHAKSINHVEINLQGIQFYLISDYLNQGNNKMIDMLIDNITIKSDIGYFFSQITFQMRDLFIRNALRFKRVNKESLIRCLKDDLKYGDQPVIYDPENKQYQYASQQNNQKMEADKQLLLFVDLNAKDLKSPFFIDVSHNSRVDLQKRRCITQIIAQINPIYIFYSLQFFEMLTTIFSTISSLSSQNLSSYQAKLKEQAFGLPFSFSQLSTKAVTGMGTTATLDSNEIRQKKQDVQILSAPQFQQTTIIKAKIRKLNFLAVKNSSVVLTISLIDLNFQHKTQPYVQRFFFNAKRFIIVDTSLQAGNHPKIIDVNTDKEHYPITGSFTKFKSQIIKHRQKKSAFFQLQIQTPQIEFLKKKVLQLVNFLMIILRQTGILAPPDQQIATKAKNPTSQPPLRYRIQINDPKIILHRSSLSTQGFKADGDSIIVTNIPPRGSQQRIDDPLSRRSTSRDKGDKSQFQQFFNNQSDQKNLFASFQLQQNNQNKVVAEIIYIYLKGLRLYGTRQWQRTFTQLTSDRINCKITPFMCINVLNIEFCSPQMKLLIPKIKGNMKQQDFRVLMRLVEQNISQTPLLFVDAPRVQTVTKMSFRTQFTIQTMSLYMNVQEKSLVDPSKLLHKKVKIHLQNLTGKNQLWTNNEIFTQMSIQTLILKSQKNEQILKRLQKQSIRQLPQLPKSKGYTDFSEYKVFSQMRKMAKKSVSQILNVSQNNQKGVKQFRSDKQDQFQTQTEIKAQQKTNTGKITQWLKGMFKKCFKCKCCRKENPKIIDKQIKKNQNDDEQDDQQIKIKENTYKNRTTPMIYRIQDVLDFDYEINWELVQKRKEQPNMIYLNFVIRPNGEKQMYMQAKEMQVLIQNSKSLMGLIPFLAKPFTVPDIPKQIKKYKFNNNKPFKMLIQVDDTLAEIKTINNNKQQRICVVCDAVYDSESRGDTTMGPGLSKMRVQSVARIFYINQNFKNSVNLSDNFKFVFLSQNQIPYEQSQRNKARQILMLTPHEMADRNISFFIPAFILKSLYRIIFDNFLKAQQQDKEHHQREMGQQNTSQMDNQKTVKKSKTLLKSKTMALQSHQGKELKMTKNKSEAPKIQLKKQIIEVQNKNGVQPPTPKDTQLIRMLFIDEITFQIQSKLQSSFVQATINNIKYYEVFINNKQFKRNIKNAFGKIGVKYWNLKLGDFQPCIQPWSFKSIQDIYQRDNLSSSNIKIASDIQRKKGDTYVNDLNINISVALFQVYKELMIYYEQQSYDQNEECIKLNEIKSDYDSLFNRGQKKKIFDPLMIDHLQRDYPKKLCKYFTRVFIREGVNNVSKYLRNSNKNYFNPPGCRVFLYHSYFDHFRRKKCITYRTPYRIMNSTNVDLALWFYEPRTKTNWKAIVKVYEYYAIPQNIYGSDLLVHITDNIIDDIFPQLGPFVSVKYLIQMRAKKKNFTKMDPESGVWKNIFKYSSPQTQKLIDYRDMIIRIGNRSFIAISVFSKHESKQQELLDNSELDFKYYDAYCILQSPIIINNYTHLDLSLTVNNTKVIKINKNQKIEINQNLSERVSQTAIQFLNDSMHEERKILFQKYGETIKIMEIQKLQSVKLAITRQTTSSVLIKIYTQWNITNMTKQDFSIKNNEKLLLLDKHSFNCLSSISPKGIDVCILHNEQYKKKIKPNNIADVITLAKLVTNYDERSIKYNQQRLKQLREQKEENMIQLKREQENKRKQEQKRKFLNKNHNQDGKEQKIIEKKQSTIKNKLRTRLQQLRQRKRIYMNKNRKFFNCFSSSEGIYEHIDFVLSVKEDPLQPVLTQKIIIRYRYQIRNLTSYKINLCQHDKVFLIAEMPPFANTYVQPEYIFYFDFIPQIYFFQVQLPKTAQDQDGKTIYSCPFKMDQFPGSTFIIKIKKEGVNVQEYQKRYFYLRIQIKKIDQETLIEIKEGDTKDFPIYIDNLTEYPIKIVENDEQFILKRQSRVPFAWSHLMSNDYKLEVSIQNVGKQTYLFNNKSAFEPLKIVDKSLKKKRRVDNKLYLKQNCYVKYDYLGIESVCLVILDLFDNKLRIHNKEQNVNTEVNMNDVLKIAPLASKIEIYFDNSQVIELMPPSKSIKNWIKRIQQCVNQDVTDKIFFTIQSYDNSRIFFFRTIGEQEFSSNKMQCSIDHLNISLITMIGPQPEEIILLYCGNISLIQHDKQNKLNYKNLQLHQSQIIMTVKKIKVSNQMKDAVNPVVLSQIKKSNYPFIQLRLVRERLQLQKQQKMKQSPEKQLKYKEQQERITHYKQVSFFIDEAEVMVEAALFLKLFGSKKHFDHVNNQYAFGTKMQDKDVEVLNAQQARKSGKNQQQIQDQKYRKSVALVDLPKQQIEQATTPQVYINYLQIKPIKMTISVYLDHNSDQDIQMNLISILRYIPFGIQNAIIQLQSCQFFHVFYDRNQLKRQILKYYSKQAFNQIYKNAGSYDMFVPIQLVGGLGNGVKKIFYDPIYELVKKKQIKAVGKTFFEGILSFIIFLFGFLLKLINVIFKLLSFFTFDQVFKTKRQAFRKQIFKSPVQGFILGAKNFLNVFKSFFIDFTKIGKYEGFFIFGYIFGFIICVLKIIPWTFKLVVSLYDWIYVIGLGIGNWGYYEQSAMKTRSRPRRTFYQKHIIQYNYFHALANQIIQLNQLQQMQNEQIYFVQSIKGGQDSNHLILSNYRIIHNYNKLTSMKEIKLYQVNEVQSRFSEHRKMYRMLLRLSIPNVHKFLFLFHFNVSEYKLYFASLDHLLFFLRKLKFLCANQELDVRFIESQQLKSYFKDFDVQLIGNLMLEGNLQQLRSRKQIQRRQNQNMGERNKYSHVFVDQNILKGKKKGKQQKAAERHKQYQKQISKNKFSLISRKNKQDN